MSSDFADKLYELYKAGVDMKENSTKDKLIDSQKRNKSLEEQIKDLEMQINQLKQEKSLQESENQKIEDGIKSERNQNTEEIKILREKALLIQELLNEKQ